MEWYRLLLALVVIMTVVLPQNPNSSESLGRRDQIAPSPPSGNDCPLTFADMDMLVSKANRFFAENQGQFGPEGGIFYYRGEGLTVIFDEGSVSFGLDGDYGDHTVIKMEPTLGRHVKPIGENPVGASLNYIIGDDRTGWVEDANAYEDIWYKSVAPGIDLHYYFRGSSVKYDVLVEPGIDPTILLFKVEGANHISIDDLDGDLLLETDVGTLKEEAPVAYQSTGGAIVPVDCGFRLVDQGTVGYTVGSYDLCQALVIDPIVEYCTYLGGKADDDLWGGEFFADPYGNVYIAGQTPSSDFPTTASSMDPTYNDGTDGFIVKLNVTTSKLEFSTFVGGKSGDIVRDIILSRDGDVCAVGNTNSLDFPTTEGSYDDLTTGDDGFLLKLDGDDGSLVFSTLVGVGGAYYLAETEDGDFFTIGGIDNDDCPVTDDAYDKTYNGYNDMQLLRFSSDGSYLEFASYIGGSGDDFASGLHINENGTIVIGGMTKSTDFPVTDDAFQQDNNGYMDVFFLRLSVDASDLEFSTYYGGSGNDTVSSMCVDDDGNIYGCGMVGSTDLTATRGVFQPIRAGKGEGYALALNSSGRSLNFMTFIGGTDSDRCESICLSSRGEVLVAGITYSADFPVTNDAYDTHLDGVNDGFLITFEANGTRVLSSSFIGGNDGELYIHISQGSSDLTWICLSTSSTDYPVTEGTFDSTPEAGFNLVVLSFYALQPSGAPPGPPLNFTAVAGDSKASLSWSPPAGYEGPDVRWYRLFRGFSMDNMTFLDKAPAGSLPSYIDDDLVNGVRYYYKVTATTAIGEGPASQVINVTPMGPPGMPRFVMATVEGDTIRLNWSMPSNLGGGELLGYWVLRGTDPDHTLPLIALGNATEYVDVNVSRCIHYFYRVLAFTIKGNGSLSEAVTAFICDVPSAPYVFNPVPALASITLYWTAPSSDGGRPVLGYKLYRGVSDTSLEPIADLASVVTYVDEGLAARTTYYYCVAAFNELGEGRRSAVVNTTTLNVPGNVKDLSVVAGDGCVTLTWTPPDDDGGSPVLGFRIFRSLGGGIVDASIDVKGGTTYLDTNVVNGRTYFYSIAAYSELGDGTRSGSLSATPFGRPMPAEGFKAEAMEDSIRLTWIAPLDDGGSPITGYRIYRGFVAEDMGLLTDVGPDRLNYTDMGLEDGLKHYYSITVLNEAGESAPSGTASATPYGRPSVIEGLEARAGDGRVMLQWSPPANDGGLSIIGYNLYRGTSGTDLVLLIRTTETMFTDDGVTNGVMYFYAVTALNGRLEGSRTMPLNATPLAPAQKLEVPGIPRGFAGGLAGRDAFLNWTAPAADPLRPVLGYIVLRGESPSNVTTVVYTGTGLDFKDVGLEPGRTYYYVVLANNTVGQGARSQVLSVSVPKEKGKEPGFEGPLAVCALAAMLMALDRRRRR